MFDEGFQRKLTVILTADVVGYSRLMREDDIATVQILKECTEEIVSCIEHHRGRVVDNPGDNLFSEFKSVVDAVKCAIEIQRKLSERNTKVPEERRMEYRIGINLGDVIDDGGRIYGDGVNVAARLESMADPGGIFISGAVYDQIKKKLNLDYQFLGKKSAKNIEEPIYVYRVPITSDAAAQRMIKATVEKMAFTLPQKPSIAVLPFTNMSGDSTQEYIGDGITENIITSLSHISEMFVIARNSTFTYKARSIRFQQIAEELGVRYVLEGSVQRSGDRIRVAAQLIDALMA